MKRVLLIIIMCFLLSGCDVSYDVFITEESINENIGVYTDINTSEYYSGSDLKLIFNDIDGFYEPIYFNEENYDNFIGGYQNGVRYYNVSRYENGNLYGLNFQNVFSHNDFYRSRAIKTCFQELDIQRNDNYYSIRTNNKCNAFDTYSLLNQISIKIKTNLEVISNNADNYADNTYTWIINRENYKNKSVRLILNSKNVDLSNFNKDNVDNKEDIKDEIEDLPQEEVEVKENNNTLIIIFGLIIFVSGSFIIILLKKHTK